MQITFNVNGSEVTVEVAPMARLLDVLREDLRLTGSKEGCGEGECGACTVLIDGVATASCLVPMAQVQGCSVVTIEGVSMGGRLSPVQDALLEHGAVQCGMCTPGFVMMSTDLLSHHPHPTPTQVRQALSGNLCRCTGYQKIVEAVVDTLADEVPTEEIQRDQLLANREELR